MRRRLGLWLGAAFLSAGGAALARRGRITPVAVSGHSMEPMLHDGDWLLVDRSPDTLEPTDIVVARDPRATGRLIVKRVGEVGADSKLVLTSDHPAHLDELIPPVANTDIIGRVVFRYWPARRIGFVQRTERAPRESGAPR